MRIVRKRGDDRKDGKRLARLGVLLNAEYFEKYGHSAALNLKVICVIDHV
jgi:hypothetical protein